MRRRGSLAATYRAILGGAISGGLYFIFVTAVEVMGFGTDAKGTRSFINWGSLLSDLGSQPVAGGVGELITMGAAVSAFGCVLWEALGEMASHGELAVTEAESAAEAILRTNARRLYGLG